MQEIIFAVSRSRTGAIAAFVRHAKELAEAAYAEGRNAEGAVLEEAGRDAAFADSFVEKLSTRDALREMEGLRGRVSGKMPKTWWETTSVFVTSTPCPSLIIRMYMETASARSESPDLLMVGKSVRECMGDRLTRLPFKSAYLYHRAFSSGRVRNRMVGTVSRNEAIGLAEGTRKTVGDEPDFRPRNGFDVRTHALYPRYVSEEELRRTVEFSLGMAADELWIE